MTSSLTSLPRRPRFRATSALRKSTRNCSSGKQDVLRAVELNAQAEGADATYITVAPTVMRQNYTQIFMEATQVSGSLDATSLYGRARESAYQLASVGLQR